MARDGHADPFSLGVDYVQELLGVVACRLRLFLHRDLVAETGSLASGQHAYRSTAGRKLRVLILSSNAKN